MNRNFYHKTYKNIFIAFTVITKWLPPNSGLKLAAERLSSRIALPNRFGMESVILHTPPRDFKKPGVLWKLKKTVYGLYDGSRAFFKAIDEDLIKMRATRIIGEEALYVFHEGEGENFRLAG